MMTIGRYRPITEGMRLEPGSTQQSTPVSLGCRDASRTCRRHATAPRCERARQVVVTAGFDVGAERPARPTIAQLREVTQPPSVRSRAAAEHWVAHAYLRDISPYFTRILLRGGFSANGVTWLMIIAAAAAAVATGWPTLLGAILAVILVQLQMLLDCCDGEVARWRQTSSPRGVYLDRVGHYVAECGIAVALGVRATGELRLSGIWISAGLLLGLLVALNKVENDLVHVARHYAGLPQMRDAEDVRVPSGVACALRGGSPDSFRSTRSSILSSCRSWCCSPRSLICSSTVQRRRCCWLRWSSRPA